MTKKKNILTRNNRSMNEKVTYIESVYKFINALSFSEQSIIRAYVKEHTELHRRFPALAQG